MIIWSGKGHLVAVFVFVCSIEAKMLTYSLNGSNQYWDQNGWPMGISLLASAFLCWYVGRILASKQETIFIEKETGKEVVVKSNHALFFIKMHWWGPILAILGARKVVMDLMEMIGLR